MATPRRNLIEFDTVRVTVIVDNTTDNLSSTPEHVTSEVAVLAAKPNAILSGEALCCAHHGLSLFIEAEAGHHKHAVLFDAGPEGATFERNVGRLSVPLETASDVVLSHGHWDHAGGLTTALSLRKNVSENAAKVHVHPGMFASRAVRQKSGIILPMKEVPSPSALERAGGLVDEGRSESLIGGGAFYLSGEIPRITSYEQGFPGHMQKDERGEWAPDPLLIDERYLAVHRKGKGLFVFSACSHAGIVNVLRDAQARFPNLPLYGAIGGFHLAGGTEPIIGETVDDLRQFGLRAIAPGHCTGWRATSALVQACGESVVTPLAVGKRFAF